MRIGLILFGISALAIAAALDDVEPNEDTLEDVGILAFDSESVQGEIREEALFREGCSTTGWVCRRKKGTCISSNETCDGRVVKGCDWNCTCCIMGLVTCEIKRTCKDNNGFCIKGSESCTGSVIPDGCTGKDCVCCVNDNNCPNGFYRVGTECFKVYHQLAGWDEARHICQEHGWNLAEPEDLPTLAQFLYTNVSHYYFWIGGRGVSGSFKYLSGQSLQDNPPWGLGYPGDKTSIADCFILRSTNMTYSATLASYDCYSKYYFICEPACPRGFIRSHSGCFKPIHTSMNWENAERHCYAEGLQIAEPEDPKRLSEMMYNGIGGTTYRNRYWIGARGGRINGSTIAWNSGDPVPVPYPINDTWYSNYPRYYTSSYCLHMYTYYWSQGPMYEYSCTSGFYSICELICPMGFFHIGNQCYKAFSSSAESWGEALEMCNRAHLTLAEPQDPIAVADYLFTITGNRNYWLGGRGNGEGFQWTSGEPIPSDWSSWKQGNPGDKVERDYCLALAPRHRTTPLISTTCDTRFYPICQ